MGMLVYGVSDLNPLFIHVGFEQLSDFAKNFLFSEDWAWKMCSPFAIELFEVNITTNNRDRDQVLH